MAKAARPRSHPAQRSRLPAEAARQAARYQLVRARASSKCLLGLAGAAVMVVQQLVLAGDL